MAARRATHTIRLGHLRHGSSRDLHQVHTTSQARYSLKTIRTATDSSTEAKYLYRPGWRTSHWGRRVDDSATTCIARLPTSGQTCQNGGSSKRMRSSFPVELNGTNVERCGSSTRGSFRSYRTWPRASFRITLRTRSVSTPTVAIDPSENQLLLIFAINAGVLARIRLTAGRSTSSIEVAPVLAHSTRQARYASSIESDWLHV